MKSILMLFWACSCALIVSVYAESPVKNKQSPSRDWSNYLVQTIETNTTALPRPTITRTVPVLLSRNKLTYIQVQCPKGVNVRRIVISPGYTHLDFGNHDVRCYVRSDHVEIKYNN